MLGQFLSSAIQLVLKIWKPILFLVILGLILFLFAIWVLSIIGFFLASPYANFIIPGKNFVAILGFICVFIVIGVPFLAVVFRGARLLLRRPVIAPRWQAGLWTFWGLSFISLFALVSFTGRQFSEGREEGLAIDLATTVNSDTLHLDLRRNLSRDAMIQLGHVILSDLQLHDGNVHLDIRRSKNGKFELEQRQYSRGETTAEATRLANEIRYQVEQDEGLLIFPEGFIIDRQGRWRAQEVRLTLWVPEGQLLTLDREVNRILDGVDVAEHHLRPEWHENRLWKMSSEGLVCIDCPESKVEDKQFEWRDFKHLQIEGEMKVLIERGEYGIRLTGKEVYTREIEVIKTGDILSISADYDDPISPVRLSVTLPQLHRLDLDQTDDVKLHGFSQPHLQVKMDGRNDLEAFVNIDSLDLQLRGRGEVELRGSGHYLRAKLADRLRLDAEHYAVAVAEVSTRNASRAALSVSDTLRRQAYNGQERISSDQDPKVVIDSQ